MYRYNFGIGERYIFRLIYLILFRVKVLYTFDEAFYDAFDGENDKTGDEYISEVLALTKQAFADTTLKAYLGRKINIVGSSKKYDSTFSQDADL